MRTFDFAPFYRSTVGFDRLFSTLDQLVGMEGQAPSYPPYDIERTGENGVWEMTLGPINAGTYRNQVFDRNSLGIWISPGKHGRMLREKWFARGERCPIVVLVGHDPLLFMAASAV